MTDRPRSDAWTSAAVAALAAAVYLVLSSSAPRWGDAVDLARRAVTEPLKPFGRAYPLQSALIRVADVVVGDPARASTIVTAVCAGIGVGLLHHVCRRQLGVGRVAALGAAGGWAVHHTYWTAAVDGEAYVLLGLFSIAALGAVLVVRSGVAGAWACGLLVGLAPLHHRASLFVVPVLLAAPFVLAPAGARRRAAVHAFAGAAIGAIPFLLLVGVEAARSGRGWSAELLSGVLVGTPRNADLLLHSERPLGASLAYVARWTLFCFVGPLVPLAAWGLVRTLRARPREALLVVALGALALVLPLRFDAVGDRYVFLVAAHPALALLAAVGLRAVAGRWGGAAAAVLAALCVLAPPAVYGALAATPTGRQRLPGLSEDAARDFLLPVRTGDPGSTEWVREVERAAVGYDVVYAEWGAGAALQYARECGGRLPGVRVVRRMPTAAELRSAGPEGALVALTPIWRHELGRLHHPPERSERLARGLHRLLPAE